MSNFDIKRFARTALWSYRMNFKGVLSFTAGLSIGCLGPYIGWIYPYLKGGGQVSAERLMHSVELESLIYLLAIIICGAWIFADMNTKERRITVKMLPATDLEKFLVRFLAVTLGAMIVSLVAFCIADLLRIVVCLVAGIDYVKFCLPDFLEMLFTNRQSVITAGSGGNEYMPGVLFMAMSWVVWAQSLYVLGGTLLRRYQFVIVSTVHVLLFIAMAALTAYAVGDIETLIDNPANGPLFFVGGGVLSGFALLNWWLSYRVFSRMQVINNKWINL